MSAIKKKPENKSISDQVRDFYRNYFQNNDPPKTKAEFEEIKRKSWDIQNLKKESRHISKTALLDVLKEKGFDAPDGTRSFKKSGIVGDIEATFEGAGKKIEQAATQITGIQQNPNPQGFGIFQQNQQMPQVPTQQVPQTLIIQNKVLSDSEKQSNKRFIVQTMQLPKNLFAQLGIIDEEEVSKQEKPKKWGDEVDEWAESLADWCNENGFSFPAKLEMIMLGVTGISLFVLPVIMKIMGNSAEKKKEAKKNHEPNPLDKLLEEEPEIVS